LLSARLLLALALAAATPARAQQAPRAGVVAAAEAGGCTLVLERATPADDALRLRPGCPLALDDLLAGVERLLAVAGADVARGGSLAMGRIVEYPWLAERLARAALAEPGWDARRGRPREGHENRFVADTLERRGLVAELAARLAAAGVSARVAGVEKVLVAPVGAAPELRALAQEGVDPAARLPFDAQWWLRVEPAPAAR
jgi:hypothetical protein